MTSAGSGATTGAGGLGGGGGGSSNGAGGEGELGEVRLRVAAANLTSGNQQSYDPGNGIRILQGINADVVLMQEVNYGLDSGEDFSPAHRRHLRHGVHARTRDRPDPQRSHQPLSHPRVR